MSAFNQCRQCKLLAHSIKIKKIINGKSSYLRLQIIANIWNEAEDLREVLQPIPKELVFNIFILKKMKRHTCAVSANEVGEPELDRSSHDTFFMVQL